MTVFPKDSVACILSIGAGHPGHIGLQPQQDGLPGHILSMMSMAKDCERQSQVMVKRFRASPHVYYRFNVEHGLQSYLWKAATGDADIETRAHTLAYIASHATGSKIDAAVESLNHPSPCFGVSEFLGE